MCREEADLALMGHLLRTWRRTGTRLKSHAELHATTITLVMALVIVLVDTSGGRETNAPSFGRQALPLQAGERNVTRNLCDVLIARFGHWCFRGDRCNRSTSKDQQGWILQLSLPERKLDWKLPEDIIGRLGLYAPLTPMASRAVSSVFALLRRRSACSRRARVSVW